MERFQREDLRGLTLQPAQAWMQPMLAEPAYIEAMAAADAYSAFSDGRCIAVAGFAVVWPGRALVAVLISDRIGTANMTRFHRVIRQRLQACGHRRVEAVVEGEFEAGHRWMRMLGFELETPGGMTGYLPDGRTAYQYARLQ